jgi:hypothetical protein
MIVYQKIVFGLVHADDTGSTHEVFLSPDQFEDEEGYAMVKVNSAVKGQVYFPRHNSSVLINTGQSLSEDLYDEIAEDLILRLTASRRVYRRPFALLSVKLHKNGDIKLRSSQELYPNSDKRLLAGPIYLGER